MVGLLVRVKEEGLSPRFAQGILSAAIALEFEAFISDFPPRWLLYACVSFGLLC